MNKTARWLVCGLASGLVGLTSPQVHAQDQQEMNRQAEADFTTADAALNKTYTELSGNLSKEDLAELKAAQRLWVQFRDTEADFEADLGARGGTLRPTIYNGVRATLTKARTEDLKKALNGE